MNLAKFFSHAFLARMERFLVGSGRAMSALSWGAQPTPAETGGRAGLRTALLGFSTSIAASRSMWVLNPCFSFDDVLINFEAAFVLRRLQALILQMAKPVRC